MIRPIAEEVTTALRDWCNQRLQLADPITAETDLLDGGYLDSLMVMELVTTIEARYGVAIDNDAISPQNFRTVAAIAALVAGRDPSDQDAREAA